MEKVYYWYLDPDDPDKVHPGKIPGLFPEAYISDAVRKSLEEYLEWLPEQFPLDIRPR